MGFSSLLQGKHSHEALLSLQDAEIRLLENVKRCLGFRVKCDREYAIALNTMCMQAQKTDLSAELSGSLVVKAWKTIVEETETFSRLVKQNADHIACITSEKLNFLINEKRNCRKVYMEEHNRIEAELLRLQDTVMRGKVEYEKSLETFKIAKVKYDEQVAKAKGSKKMEEAREKYIKACRKLHRIHNDYVLWLCEAAEYEKSFRTALLPSLLEFQQNMQEELIDQWRTILSELVHYTDLSAAKFQELHGLMTDTVQGIVPASEYKEFMNKHKSPPALPTMFIFDRTLVEDYNGKLKPNTLIVDDLTFTFLNLKLIELDEKMKNCQQMIKEKQHELIKCENELSALRKSPEMAPTIFIKKKIIETIRREMFELKSKEQGYQKQREVLSGPLSQVTDVGPAPALDIKLTSNEDEENRGSKLDLLKFLHNEPGGTIGKIQSRNFVQMLRKPFIKRQSMHALSTFNLKDPTLKAEAVTFHSQPSSPARNKLIVHTDLSLQDEDWFHGVLPREEVVRLLVSDGDFLVRETIRNNEQQIVVSVKFQGHKHFIVQLTLDGKYRFEGPAFPTIQELILSQYRSGLPVTNKSGAILRNPIFRERWELNNDDVELITKIGRGNFGDVYKARLQSNGQEVAVKTCHMTLPEEQKKKFLQEGRILKQYDHPNIVKLIGICVQKQPIMIVMELVSGGSLLSFLRNSGSSLSVYQRVTMSVNCAAGMEYLESKNCIHRDLAARNCLISKETTVKISDFGMSREEEEYVVSDGMKQIPIKWTAPEALNFGKYTSLCDVWSYGVLVWEIFSNGSSPYSGLSNAKARELIDSGFRMPAPDGTPEAVYKLMLRCWQYDCELRPHFNELHAALLEIARDIKEHPEPGDNC